MNAGTVVAPAEAVSSTRESMQSLVRRTCLAVRTHCGESLTYVDGVAGFQSIQTEGSNRDAPYPMHPALARAWLESGDPADQLWFGN